MSFVRERGPLLLWESQWWGKRGRNRARRERQRRAACAVGGSQAYGAQAYGAGAGQEKGSSWAVETVRRLCNGHISGCAVTANYF